jgi:hypothetical protein
MLTQFIFSKLQLSKLLHNEVEGDIDVGGLGPVSSRIRDLRGVSV